MILFSMFAIVASVSAADGDVIYVNGSSGNDDNDGFTIKTAKLTIKNATGAVKNNGTVHIANGKYNGVGNTEITIDKNMTIIGESQAGTIINGTGTNWIFHILYVNVKIQNLTFINGTSDNGGAIHNQGTLTIKNAAFKANNADNCGGAIYNDGGTVTISKSIFTSNTACNGGAICNNGGELTVNNSTIQQNTATNTSKTIDVTAAGGGILNEPNGTLNLDNCIIQNNIATATGEGVNIRATGGGICNGGKLYIKNSLIQKNTARSTTTSQLDIVSAEGGGIYNENVLVIMNSTIQNNTVTATADKDLIAYGAGIYNSGDTIIDNSKIKYNTAAITTQASVGIYGGGIFNSGNLYINGSKIEYNTIKSNTSGINRIGGGAISNSNTGNVYINRGNIQYNTATAINGDIYIFGGGIYNENVLIISNSTIQYNKATIINGDKYAHALGGGVCNFGDMIANFNRIVNNSPGAIYNDAESVPDLQYNWWGSNTPKFNEIITGTPAVYDPWLVMKYGASPKIILRGDTSILTADFRYDSDGKFHDPVLGHLPDGTVVTFTTNLGNVGSKIATSLTSNGVATIILRADEAAGTALTSAALDNQTQHANLIIKSVKVKGKTTNDASTGTIGMQKTGTPLIGIFLAILVVFGGLFTSKKK